MHCVSLLRLLLVFCGINFKKKNRPNQLVKDYQKLGSALIKYQVVKIAPRGDILPALPFGMIATIPATDTGIVEDLVSCSLCFPYHLAESFQKAERWLAVNGLEMWIAALLTYSWAEALSD